MRITNNQNFSIVKWIFSIIVIIINLAASTILLSEYLDYEDKFELLFINSKYSASNNFLIFIQTKAQVFVDILNTFPKILVLVLCIMFFLCALLHFIITYYEIKITIFYAIFKSSMLTAALSLVVFYLNYLTNLTKASNDIIMRPFGLFMLKRKFSIEAKLEFFKQAYLETIDQYKQLSTSTLLELSTNGLNLGLQTLNKDLINKLSSGAMVAKAREYAKELAHLAMQNQIDLDKSNIINSVTNSSNDTNNVVFWVTIITCGIVLCVLAYYVWSQHKSISDLHQTSKATADLLDSTRQITPQSFIDLKKYLKELGVANVDDILFLSKIGNSATLEIIVSLSQKLVVHESLIVKAQIQIEQILLLLNRMPPTYTLSPVELGELPPIIEDM